MPMTEAHRRGVVDPLTAGLVPAPAAGDILAPAACERTLAMFDGGHRFDMALAFKRMDAAKTEPGYGGPVVVCGMTYRPISGHSPTGWRVKHLIGREGMEMWFAPLGGARLLAMYRISIPTMVGTAVLSATRFEAAAGR